MTPTQLQEIARSARNAAMAARNGWPVKCPHPEGTEAAKVWQSRFDAALKGGANV